MSSGVSALKYGLLFGAILTIIIGITVASGLIGFDGFFIVLVFNLMFGFIAGVLASRQTGQSSTGSLAGFLIGLISTIALYVSIAIAIRSNPAIFITGAFFIIAAWITGSIGGNIGKNQKRVSISQTSRERAGQSPREPEYYETGKNWMRPEWQIVHQIEVNKEWAMIFNQRTLIYEVFAKGKHWGECRTHDQARELMRQAKEAYEKGEL